MKRLELKCILNIFEPRVISKTHFTHPPVITSASKRSIRRFVIMEKAPTRAFSWVKAAT